MKVHISKFPPDIITKYKLNEIKDAKGYIYIKIKKGMYGLKQASILAYHQLVKILKPHGYYPEPHSVGMWSHHNRKTKFCLCVDDFGIKYFNRDDATHLLQALKSFYATTEDWSGAHYCGLTLNWNYKDGYVDVSMPGYVEKQLHRYQHPKPPKAQYAPHKWSVPSYGTSPQHIQIDISDPLNSTDENLV